MFMHVHHGTKKNLRHRRASVWHRRMAALAPGSAARRVPGSDARVEQAVAGYGVVSPAHGQNHTRNVIMK
jgi:hypothetical protein